MKRRDMSAAPKDGRYIGVTHRDGSGAVVVRWNGWAWGRQDGSDEMSDDDTSRMFWFELPRWWLDIVSGDLTERNEKLSEYHQNEKSPTP